MLNKEDLLGFALYEKIITFSLDTSWRGERDGDNGLTGKLSAQFYDRMYFDREWAEDKIEASIRGSDQVLSIEGIEGCGKSTTTKRVLDSLKDDYRSIVLDFNKLASRDDFVSTRGDYAAFKIAMEKALKDSLLAEDILEPADLPRGATEGRDGDSPQERSVEDRMQALHEYALFSQSELPRNDFARARLSLLSMARGEVDISDRDAVLGWFRNNMGRGEIKQLVERINDEIRYVHIIDVAQELFHTGLVVVLDNVDRLQHVCQPLCYDFALSFNNEVEDRAKIIINIRPENAHTPEGSMGPRSEHVDTVKLVAIGHLQCYLDSDHFHDILNKRQSMYIEHVGGTTLSSKLQLIASALKDQYAEVVLIDLANQSIRSALKYHCDFLRHVLSHCPFEAFMELRKNESHRSLLTSLLLGWIAECGQVLSEQHLNLAHIVQKAESSGFTERGCDLSYLILVRLEKQTISPHGETIYRVPLKALTNDLGLLGFEPEEVRNEVYHLFFLKNRDFGHIISVSNDEVVHNVESISEETTVALNFRGKRLVQSVSTMFFFVNRLHHNTKDTDILEFEGEFGYYSYSQYGVHAKANVILFARVARLHTVELRRIAGSIGGIDWYDKYKKRFTIAGRLQLTRVLQSNIAFLNASRRHLSSGVEQEVKNLVETMNLLISFYEKQVAELSGNTSEIYDFVKIVGFCVKRKVPSRRELFEDDDFKVAIDEFA